MMMATILFVQVIGLFQLVIGNDFDEFNYGETKGRSFGPSDWIQVQCGSLQTCRGWPDASWEMAQDWSIKENSWCVSRFHSFDILKDGIQSL
jgi:hypothetical protein